MDFKQHFLYQTDYQHWANELLFNALDRLDDGARKAPLKSQRASLHDGIDHLAYFTRKWLTRLRGEDFTLRHADAMHPDWRELKATLRQDMRAMLRWLEQQPPAFFDAPLNYRRSFSQEARRVWVRDALTHIYTHAAMERGSIASLAASMGAPLVDMSYAGYRQEMGEHLDRLRRTDSGTEH